MAEYVQAATNLNPSWRRWFRRTNVYIAEYILMLLFVGVLLALLVSLWYSFFHLATHDDYTGKLLAQTTAASIGAVLVVAPVAFWLYARVTGQEMVEPVVKLSKARMVFLTLWLIGAVCLAVGVAISLVTGLTSATFGVKDVSDSIVGMFVPALFALPTVIAGIFMVVKRVSRKFVMQAGMGVAIVTLLLVIGCSIMVFVRKDASGSSPTIDIPSNSSCTYNKYIDGDCTFSEYRRNTMD